MKQLRIIGLLTSAVLALSVLSACNEPAPEKGSTDTAAETTGSASVEKSDFEFSVKEFLNELYSTAADPEQTQNAAESVAPGTPTPVKYLNTAAKAWLGKRISLEISAEDESVAVAYYKNAADGGKDLIAILLGYWNSEEGDGRAKSALLCLEADFDSITELCGSVSDTLSGKILSVAITDYTSDYVYPVEKCRAAAEASSKNAAAERCIIVYEKTDETVLFTTPQDAGYAEAENMIYDVYNRFSVIAPAN